MNVMSDKNSEILSEMGSIRIADEVVSTVAGIAAGEVEGIHTMSGGLGSDLAERFGRKNLSKGIKVEVNEDQTKIDIFVVIKYGYTIPRVAENVQSAVRAAVETMTGLTVTAVNVHVSAVVVGKPETGEEPEVDFTAE
jgi:uncharacterized alkaline shock family protein YloU